ncbi:hypothetical protein CsatA_022637 [Cannabis sativa]
MGLKSLANKAKGKRPIIEEEDSYFAPPLTKRGRAPPKKKTKVGVQEKMAEDVYGKNNNVGAAVQTEVCFRCVLTGWRGIVTPRNFGPNGVRA